MNKGKAEENKRIVTEFYHAYGIEKDAEKCREFFGDRYIQHNPHVQDGVDHFLRFVQYRKEHYPQGENRVMMTLGDDDKVMLHVHSVLVPGDPGRNLVDTFRVEDGKVVEHWDVIQNVEVLKFPPINDNGLFNQCGDSILCDPDKTDENRALVTAFYETYGLEKDAGKCAGFLGSTYTQHNPHVQDGPEAFLKFVEFRKKNYPHARNEIKITVAQGNLVGFHVHSLLTPDDPGRNLVDIFRVEKGKIVEHWDTIQNIEVLKFPPINDNGLY
ncbi:nuclear transport factor 2 family protein [Oscillibacter sp.]|uniref:nuclear transport factor 2 family protein n=1 Tax=Oscillibacter sp. TaxID=1945593 RepID=UPI0028A05147|nr:nuclear transport factor 2 family protein [Oscillibacter sp.]